MPVIINDFEAIAEPSARTSPAEPDAAPDAAAAARKKAMIEPQDVKPALQILAQQALRCWAH